MHRGHGLYEKYSYCCKIFLVERPLLCSLNFEKLFTLFKSVQKRYFCALAINCVSVFLTVFEILRNVFGKRRLRESQLRIRSHWVRFMISWGLDYGLISRSTKGLLAWGGSTLAGSDKHTLGPVLIPTLLTFLPKTCSRTSFVYSQHDACLQPEERTIRVYKQTLKCYDSVGKVLKLKFFMH